MPPQWTQPLDVSILSSSPPSMTSPTFDYEAQFHYPLHDVPTTPSIIARVTGAENRIRRNASEPLHAHPSHAIPHPHPTFPHIPRLHLRAPKSNRAPPSIRLNRLHFPVPSDLSRFAPRVRSEFLRVSGVAANKYAPPPDPTDDYDHSFFEFPSVVVCDKYPQHQPEHHPSPSPPIEEPRRRNIRYLIERYNNNDAYALNTPPNPRSPTSSAISPTPPRNPHKLHHQFNIRSVRDIFERHTQKMPEHADISLSSVTDSTSPSHASHLRIAGCPTTNTAPSENRPQRIAFADLSNTLDLSPYASSTSDTDPDQRHVPVLTPPPHSRVSPTVYFLDELQRPVGRKKSFALFRPLRGEHAERIRSKSFANEARYPTQPANQASAKRFTNAERPKKKWVPKQVYMYGGNVRRRFESFCNMISADD